MMLIFLFFLQENYFFLLQFLKFREEIIIIGDSSSLQTPDFPLIHQPDHRRHKFIIGDTSLSSGTQVYHRRHKFIIGDVNLFIGDTSLSSGTSIFSLETPKLYLKLHDTYKWILRSCINFHNWLDFNTILAHLYHFTALGIFIFNTLAHLYHFTTLDIFIFLLLIDLFLRACNHLHNHFHIVYVFIRKLDKDL